MLQKLARKCYTRLICSDIAKEVCFILNIYNGKILKEDLHLFSLDGSKNNELDFYKCDESILTHTEIFSDFTTKRFTFSM